MGNIARYLQKVKPHRSLILVLVLQLALALAYTSLIPLGEAPDEPAHLSYAQFIAKTGRLPANLDERQAASYRANWPPLYHFLIAAPLAAVGETPPSRLKAVGDTVRRLIPTDGQTIAAFIHTTDETWPWRGLPLAWHLSRLISVLLAALSVGLTYLIAWRLTGQRRLAVTAAAIQAFIPQALFIGGVVNDDNLLILLASLFYVTLISFSARDSALTVGQTFLVGLLLGLATVAKYNALPLGGMALIWFGWQIYHWLSLWRVSGALQRILVLFGGVGLGSGWWFYFIWRNFNQVTSQGLIQGSLAALAASTSDTSLQNLAAGRAPSVANLAWGAWLTRLFESFWGSFGGGGAIDFPPWIYGLLGLFCLAALISPIRAIFTTLRSFSEPLLFKPKYLFLLTPLFFLPLLLLRFSLSGGKVVETAQGRHLFPALPAISLALAWGLSTLPFRITRRSQAGGAFWLDPALGLILFLFCLSLYGLGLIRAGYPPLIPLRTTAEAATAENLVQQEITDGIFLVGYELGQAQAGQLPVTLIWRADSVPQEDYLIKLAVTDSGNRVLGSWLGHPLGGRYPTRAWDAGDVLRHTIPVALAPGPTDTEAILALQLLTAAHQPASGPVVLAESLTLPPIPNEAQSAPALRADELPPQAAFTYRSSLSFALPHIRQEPLLATPAGQTFPADLFLATAGGGMAHFIVGPHWPSGLYQLKTEQATLTEFTVRVSNRLRQFETPPLAYPVQANFANRLTLLGYDLPRRRVQPGDAFPITLHWQVEQTIDQHLTVFNHLLDDTHTQRGGVDRIPLKYYTSLLWAPG